jgi:glycosyltransferase involved in cell wall biosynthesis
MIWRKPCVLLSTIHDLAPFHVQGKYDPLRMFYGRVIVKHLARRQDGIIAISTNTAEDIQRFFGIPISKQNILLNGLDHARFKPAESGSTPKVDWILEHPYFLYVSRLEHPAKNHVRLIEAFNQFKAASGSPWLLALGGSDWHGAEVIHAAAKASPYAKDIRFLGFVSDATLPDLYRGAGAFVYPSLFEGFGLPPVEAMASGCPVISSTRGSLDEVVSDAALRIDPENIEEMAAALTTLATDENARKDLIRRGFANAKRFDWAKNGHNYLDICRLLINKYKN